MKILEIAQPLITCYPHHANHVATVMTNDFDFCDIASNFISTIYNSDNKRIDFNYGIHITNYVRNYPHFNMYCYKRNIIKQTWGSFSEFVKCMIDADCYVYLLVDTYYIPNYRNWYHISHTNHDILLYGYDDKNFYAADFFENGKYSFETFQQNILDEAEIDIKSHDWLDGIHCWELKEDMYRKMWIDPTEVKQALRSYIDGTRLNAVMYRETKFRKRNDSNYHFGMSMYDFVINDVKEAKTYVDIRIPYFLLAQKRVLNYICQTLEKEYKINDFTANINNIRQLEKNCSILLNLFIKYNITNNESIKDSIIIAIKSNMNQEIIVLEKLYQDIQHKSEFVRPQRLDYSKRQDYHIDESTSGNWKDKYGSKGYYIIGDKINLPDCVTIHTNNCRYISIIRNKADERGLCRLNNDNRLVAYYSHNQEFNIVIGLKEETKISLYLLDYEELDRKERIIVQKKRTGEAIAEHKFTDFKNGVYFTFTANEDIVISGRCLNGPDATVSAIFFD